MCTCTYTNCVFISIKVLLFTYIYINTLLYYGYGLRTIAYLRITYIAYYSTGLEEFRIWILKSCYKYRITTRVYDVENCNSCTEDIRTFVQLYFYWTTSAYTARLDPTGSLAASGVQCSRKLYQDTLTQTFTISNCLITSAATNMLWSIR